MIYELRVYRCVPGRQSALLSRFKNETLRIWEKHGIRQAGFWTTLIGKSSQEITYMLAWDTREALERFSRRSRMGRGGRQDRERWPARREHKQPVADASRVFCREVRLWMRA
jgi:heme-degrading monooxygenase HmoA